MSCVTSTAIHLVTFAVTFASAQENENTPAPTPACRKVARAVQNASAALIDSAVAGREGRAVDDTTADTSEKCEVVGIPCWLFAVLLVLLLLCCSCCIAAAFLLGRQRKKQREDDLESMEVFPSSPKLIAPNNTMIAPDGTMMVPNNTLVTRSQMADLMRSGSFSGGPQRLGSFAFGGGSPLNNTNRQVSFVEEGVLAPPLDAAVNPTLAALGRAGSVSGSVQRRGTVSPGSPLMMSRQGSHTSAVGASPPLQHAHTMKSALKRGSNRVASLSSSVIAGLEDGHGQTSPRSLRKSRIRQQTADMEQLFAAAGGDAAMKKPANNGSLTIQRQDSNTVNGADTLGTGKSSASRKAKPLKTFSRTRDLVDGEDESSLDEEEGSADEAENVSGSPSKKDLARKNLKSIKKSGDAAVTPSSLGMPQGGGGQSHKRKALKVHRKSRSPSPNPSPNAAAGGDFPRSPNAAHKPKNLKSISKKRKNDDDDESDDGDDQDALRNATVEDSNAGFSIELETTHRKQQVLTTLKKKNKKNSGAGDEDAAGEGGQSTSGHPRRSKPKRASVFKPKVLRGRSGSRTPSISGEFGSDLSSCSASRSNSFFCGNGDEGQLAPPPRSPYKTKYLRGRSRSTSRSPSVSQEFLGPVDSGSGRRASQFRPKNLRGRSGSRSPSISSAGSRSNSFQFLGRDDNDGPFGFKPNHDADDGQHKNSNNNRKRRASNYRPKTLRGRSGSRTPSISSASRSNSMMMTPVTENNNNINNNYDDVDDISQQSSEAPALPRTNSQQVPLANAAYVRTSAARQPVEEASGDMTYNGTYMVDLELTRTAAALDVTQKPNQAPKKSYKNRNLKGLVGGKQQQDEGANETTAAEDESDGALSEVASHGAAPLEATQKPTGLVDSPKSPKPSQQQQKPKKQQPKVLRGRK